MSVKLLTEHHLEFLSLKGCCTGSSESTLVKMSHCWKSHAVDHIVYLLTLFTLACVFFSIHILYISHSFGTYLVPSAKAIFITMPRDLVLL